MGCSGTGTIFSPRVFRLALLLVLARGSLDGRLLVVLGVTTSTTSVYLAGWSCRFARYVVRASFSLACSWTCACVGAVCVVCL
jgi:hypothetical protein